MHILVHTTEQAWLRVLPRSPPIDPTTRLQHADATLIHLATSGGGTATPAPEQTSGKLERSLPHLRPDYRGCHLWTCYRLQTHFWRYL
jgi:hypothetical protein